MFRSMQPKKICICGLTLALMLGLLTGCSAPSLESNRQPDGSAPGSTSASTSAPTEPAEEVYADYPRFTDQVVTEQNHLLTLSNGKKNQYAFVYTLSSAGQTLYQSPKLQPGENEAWDILQSCTASCTLDITITAYSLPDGKEQNSVIQTIQLSLPEATQSPAGSADSVASSQPAESSPNKTKQPVKDPKPPKKDNPKKVKKPVKQKKTAKQSSAEASI